MRRTIPVVALLLVLAVVAGSAGCAPKKQFVTIVTGGTAGTYYPVGTIMAALWNEKLGKTGVVAAAQSSGGSVENLNMLKSGEAQLGIAMCNLTYFAAKGQERFDGKPFPDVRFLTALWPDVSQFVVTQASGVNAFSDLRGKKFSVGSAGSGTEYSSRMILDIIGGLKYADFTPEYLSYGDASAAMQNGQLAGMNAEGGVPTTAVAEISASRTPVRMLQFTDSEYRRLNDQIPFYVQVTIPANTYSNQPEAIKTIGVKCAVVASKGLSEKLAYDLVKAMYENLETMQKSHKALGYLTLQGAIEGLPKGVPLHVGAYKFFKEKGLNIPAELIPPEAKK